MKYHITKYMYKHMDVVIKFGVSFFVCVKYNLVISMLLYCVFLVVRKPVFGVPTRSDTNRAVQPHKMARGLKFRI